MEIRFDQILDDTDINALELVRGYEARQDYWNPNCTNLYKGEEYMSSFFNCTPEYQNFIRHFPPVVVAQMVERIEELENQVLELMEQRPLHSAGETE